MVRGRRTNLPPDGEIDGKDADFAMPFEQSDINCSQQTGADWYRLMLAASLGGKSIHGLNPTPSCEMISKVDEEFASRYVTGRIRFDPQTRRVPSLGDKITDQHYIHKDFKGISSGTGSFFSFDQGMWEPSMRKRAREASILAATLASHTNDKRGSCEIVSKITSDEINEEAVDVAYVPVSHLKRDVVTVSKRSHRVFSCGSIQRAIVWDDTHLISEKLPEIAAVDWGRIIALARTLAEGNIQLDPRFAEYARAHGVPYALVRGCYAYVQYGDYVFDPKVFSDVPKIDLKKFGIPTLRDAYDHAAESILKQCYVNLSRLSYDDTSASAEMIWNVVRDCKLRIRGAVPRRSTWTETDVLGGPGSHSVDAYAAARATSSEATSKNAFDEAYLQVISQSANLQRLARKFAVSRQQKNPDYTTLDEVNKIALKQDTWELAFSFLAAWLGNRDVAEARMASYKKSMFTSSTPLHVPHPLTGNALVKARRLTQMLLPKAVITPAPNAKKIKEALSFRQTQGATTMQVVVQNMISHFNDFRRQWSKRYADWAQSYFEIDGMEAKRLYIEYMAATFAFDHITRTTALAIQSRFMDPAAPKESYIYKFALDYAKGEGMKTITLDHPTYMDARVLARELDAKLNPPHSFAACEEACYDRLSFFAGDFGVTGEVVTAAEIDEEYSQDQYEALIDNPYKPMPKRKATALERAPFVLDMGGTKVAMANAPPAEFDMLGSLLMADEPEETAPTYSLVRATYESESSVDAHARANGFADFQEAYEALKGGARFDPASEYTMKGLAVSQAEREDYDDGTILA